MKSHTRRTIAIAVAVLLTSGAYATAGEYFDIERNGSGERDLSVSSSPRSLGDVPQRAGGVIDIDQDGNGPSGGGGRIRLLRKPRVSLDDEQPNKTGRFVGIICLINPVMGQTVCWGG